MVKPTFRSLQLKRTKPTIKIRSLQGSDDSDSSQKKKRFLRDHNYDNNLGTKCKLLRSLRAYSKVLPLKVK